MLSTKAGEQKTYTAQGSQEILLHNGNKHEVAPCYGNHWVYRLKQLYYARYEKSS